MFFGCLKKGGSVPRRHQQPSSHAAAKQSASTAVRVIPAGWLGLISSEHRVDWHNKNARVFHVLPEEVKPVLWIKKGLIL